MKIDTACKLNGWCADAAVTLPIGEVRPEKTAADPGGRGDAQTRHRSRWAAAASGGREVAVRMQQHVEQAGFSVVTQYVGHGIGRIMHENPQVPELTSTARCRKHDFRLEPGLVLAVEPMVNMGRAGRGHAPRPLDGRDPRPPAERPRRAHAGVTADGV